MLRERYLPCLRDGIPLVSTSILGYRPSEILDQRCWSPLEKEFSQLCKSRSYVLAFAGCDDVPVLAHLENGGR